MIGACQLFRRQTFYFVGGLDEWYFYGPEDVDFCLRIREAGLRVAADHQRRLRAPARAAGTAGCSPRGASATRWPCCASSGSTRRSAEGRGPGVTLTDFASVTVAYGSADVIGDVVDSLADLPGCSEVVVVDNGRRRFRLAAPRPRRRASSGDPENPGFGAAVKTAVCGDHVAPMRCSW